MYITEHNFYFKNTKTKTSLENSFFGQKEKIFLTWSRLWTKQSSMSTFSKIYCHPFTTGGV